jgi:hypothetical protein
LPFSNVEGNGLEIAGFACVRIAPIGRWLSLIVCVSACTEYNGALGNVLFTYDCSNAGPTPSDDAWCDTDPDRSVMPVLAVGAGFTIASDSESPAAPAVTDLVETGQAGTQWRLVQPGWLGILAMSGATVVDYTHIRGLNLGTIALSLVSSDRSSLSDSTFSTQGPGAIGSVVVTPLADNGALLAGAIPCAFGSSSSAVAVDGTGRVGSLTTSMSGDATITAICLGRQAQVQVHVSIATPPVRGADTGTMTDVANDNGLDDVTDVAKEGANDVTTNAPKDASSDAPADAETAVDSEAGISDAVDSRSFSDAEGG